MPVLRTGPPVLLRAAYLRNLGKGCPLWWGWLQSDACEVCKSLQLRFLTAGQASRSVKGLCSEMGLESATFRLSGFG